MTSPFARAAGANDRIRATVIGRGGRGRDHMLSLAKIPGVEVATKPGRAAWTRLAVAVTMAVFQEMHNSPPIAALVQGLWVKAGYGPPQPHASDSAIDFRGLPKHLIPLLF